MTDPSHSRRNTRPIEWELYFLIERFLSAGPCKSAAKILRCELDEHGLLPKRLDWKGEEHERSFDSLLELNKHIGGDHLLRICERLGPLLDEKIPCNITGVRSLLGAGSQALLRTTEDMQKSEWLPQTHMVLHHGCSLFPPLNLVQPKRLFVLRGQEIAGKSHFSHIAPSLMYTNIQQQSRKLGHLSAVYCVLFDRTGEFIFTGADDSLVKIWWVADSRLKATLRGHNAEITDMAVNYENTLLASGSCDKTIRVWCLRSKAPAAVLHAHTGMITSVQFSPMVRGNTRFLASTGGDACVCFWEWNVLDNAFNVRPIKYIEKSRAGAQVLCSSFSPGGIFFAAGSTDNVIRMYHFHAGYPEKIGELEKHTDHVDSICYANNDNRFLSGSKDGTARIWKFERNEWRNILLEMSMTLKKKDSHCDIDRGKKTPYHDGMMGNSVQQKLRVTMVGWSKDDSLVITAISDCTIKVWCSHTGALLHILQGHKDEIFVLEASPIDSRIVVSAGHDGNIIIWDIMKGMLIKEFFNMIEGQGHGAVFDCKISPDSTRITATDSHGHLIIFGFGTTDRYCKIPDALFFHTDYRPLMRDSNGFVLDEQTQQAPHLMPPPFLVDIDGNPYPPIMQRLVPGRENCRDDQLIPEVGVNEEGEQEVVGERVPEPVEEILEVPNGSVPNGEVQALHRPSIDQMIEQLAREQDQRLAQRGHGVMDSPPPTPHLGSPRAGPSWLNSAQGGNHMVGMRRVGETEGVRQSLGNILQVSTSKDLVAISHRIVVKELDPQVLKKDDLYRVAMGEAEVHHYHIEKRKKNQDESNDVGILAWKKKPAKNSNSMQAEAVTMDTATNRLTRRALYDTDNELDEMNSDMWEEGQDSVVENGDSSDYSEWSLDLSSNLQPPKRKSSRLPKRKRFTSSEELGDDDENEGSQSKGKGPKKKDSKSETKKKKVIKSKKTAVEVAALPGKSPEEIQELLTKWRPPDWLTDVIPHKQPYFPQMGDEIMYFRHGHELYVKAVESRKAYPIDSTKNQAWHKYTSLREQELVRIVGIRYEMLRYGVRLCCLKLAYIDPVTLKNNGGCFSIKYHDMPDVVDFLVLKQNYDIAIKRNWKPGARFRSIIDDSWWMGIIEDHIPYQQEYPDCFFQCFKVRWDNAERELLSPWDLEPIAHSKVPSVIGGCVLVTPEELKALMYKPKPNDWPGGNKDQECDRIVHGWEQVMEHSIAEPFLTPVDLNAFPSYAMTIEYPMDLNTIKRRLENRFYRRVTALQFDLRYIETNAKKFNEPRSQIVRSAQILCDALLTFISDKCTDPCQLINKLGHGRKIQTNSDSGEETEDYDTPGTSSAAGKNKTYVEDTDGTSQSAKRRRLSVNCLNPDDWKTECRHLLDTIMQCEDSEPFRVPVDINDYPNYYEVVENPMDLQSIGEYLDNGVYKDPLQLAKDMRLIFSNSKSYNTNKRSKIYTMTLRLSAMFESRIKEIITTWKQAMKGWKGRCSNEWVPTSSHGSASTKPSTSGLSVNLSKATLYLTNGKPHTSNEKTDIDESRLSPSRQATSYKRTRPVRARRTVQEQTGYIYSDGELQFPEFPEPKPDYTDDDFEIQPRKSSPKKKALMKKNLTDDVTNSTSNTRYSTRAKTGTLKMRKYSNAGFFTDDDEEEEDEEEDDTVINNDNKNSRSHKHHAKISGKGGKRSTKKKLPQKHKHFHSTESDMEIRSAKSSQRQLKKVDHRVKQEADYNETTSECDTDSDKLTNIKPQKEHGRPKLEENKNVLCKKSKRVIIPSEKESSSSTSKSLSDSSASEDGWELGSEPHHSPATRSAFVAQESHKNIDNDSDSGPHDRPSSHQNFSVAFGSSSRQGRRTRYQGKQTVKYNEESGNSDTDDNATVTVSMRGRVRKPTARARAMWD